MRDYEKIANENVQRGAKLLDERLPGWYKVIDQTRLDIKHTRHCVLGQIFKEYDKGVMLLFDVEWFTSQSIELEYTHGFVLPSSNRRAELGVSFELANQLLNKEWRRQINRRLTGVSNADD